MKKAQETVGTEAENNWRNKAFDVKQSYDSLLMALAKNYPRYHQLKYNTAALSLVTLQERLLDKNEALLEYFWGEAHLFLFLIDKHHAHLFKLANNEQLAEQINTVRNIITQRKDQPADFSKNAYQLYEQLCG
jgi:hypothetical protein